jgi:hypothetical protein
MRLLVVEDEAKVARFIENNGFGAAYPAAQINRALHLAAHPAK